MTDRDMERARDLLSALDGYTASPRPAHDTLRLAAALAVERAPLGVRIAELEAALAGAHDGARYRVKQLTSERDEARHAMRALLAGHLHSSDDVRRQAIAAAEETVRRWDAGEPQVTGHCPTCAERAREMAVLRDRCDGLLSDSTGLRHVNAGVERALGEHATTGDLAADVARVVAELGATRAQLSRLSVETSGSYSLSSVEAIARSARELAEERGARWGIDAAAKACDEYREGIDAAISGSDAFFRGEVSAAEDCALEVRAIDAADVVRAAREREAPAAEPTRPLAVGDRVRVVRCCPTLRALCCGEWCGHVGELVRIVEGARLPYQIADPDGRSLYFAEVERVEPAREREAPLTARQLAAALRHLVRGCAGDEPLHADFAEELAAEIVTAALKRMGAECPCCRGDGREVCRDDFGQLFTARCPVCNGAGEVKL